MPCACGKNRWEVCAVKKRITVIRSFLIFMLLLLAAPVSAKAEDMQLYAQSAVLMDGDSGRILFGKNEQEVRAMASTTKIMTCILVLEIQIHPIRQQSPKTQPCSQKYTLAYKREKLFT